MQFPTGKDCESAGTRLTSDAGTVTTMSPTLVIPAATGAKLPDCPTSEFPPALAVALTTMFPLTVGTPGMAKVPSAWVVPDCEPVVTVAPETGTPLLSTTRPDTVVPGSGMTFTATFCAVPIFPPRSNAVAPNVIMVIPVGTVKLN